MDSEGVEQSNNVRLDKGDLRAQVSAFRNIQPYTIKRTDIESVMLGQAGCKRGWLRYDGDDRTDIRELRCVIVGTKKSASDVLVIVLQWSEDHSRLERVGVGSVAKNLISSKSPVEARVL